MKFFVYIFVQFAFIVTTFAQTKTYVSTNLNLRNGPSTLYQVINTIPAGTNINLIENYNNEWAKINYNGSIGYINTKYLKNKNVKSTEHNSSTTVKYYNNSKGERVQSPTYYNAAPAGATALCRDGTYSFSRSRRGTCSHHGGVAKWL